MSTQTLTAIAAISAAIVSLINVALTAIFAQRQAGIKWLRDLLPEVIGNFTDAAFQYEYVIFETDWTTLTMEEQRELGKEEFRRASALENKLNTFACPETIEAARNLLHSVSAINRISHDLIVTDKFAIWEPMRKRAYWAYAEERHAFLIAARKEMGLEPPPVPPGLERWRNATEGQTIWHSLMGPPDSGS